MNYYNKIIDYLELFQVFLIKVKNLRGKHKPFNRRVQRCSKRSRVFGNNF